MGRAICVFLMLLVSALPQAPKTSGFTARFLCDESVPQGTNLEGIGLQVYRETKLDGSPEGVEEYEGEYEFSVLTNEAGEAVFDRPAQDFSASVSLYTLPAGLGVRETAKLFNREETEHEFCLASIRGARLEADWDPSCPTVRLLDGEGQVVYAPCQFTPSYTLSAEDPDILLVSGQVVTTDGQRFEVSDAVDLTGMSKTARAGTLYSVGLLSREEYEAAMAEWNHF